MADRDWESHEKWVTRRGGNDLRILGIGFGSESRWKDCKYSTGLSGLLEVLAISSVSAECNSIVSSGVIWMEIKGISYCKNPYNNKFSKLMLQPVQHPVLNSISLINKQDSISEILLMWKKDRLFRKKIRKLCKLMQGCNFILRLWKYFFLLIINKLFY